MPDRPERPHPAGVPVLGAPVKALSQVWLRRFGPGSQVHAWRGDPGTPEGRPDRPAQSGEAAGCCPEPRPGHVLSPRIGSLPQTAAQPPRVRTYRRAARPSSRGTCGKLARPVSCSVWTDNPGPGPRAAKCANCLAVNRLRARASALAPPDCKKDIRSDIVCLTDTTSWARIECGR